MALTTKRQLAQPQKYAARSTTASAITARLTIRRRRVVVGMTAVYHACWRSRENRGGCQRLAPAMLAGITQELWTMDPLYDEVMA